MIENIKAGSATLADVVRAVRFAYERQLQDLRDIIEDKDRVIMSLSNEIDEAARLLNDNGEAFQPPAKPTKPTMSPQFASGYAPINR